MNSSLPFVSVLMTAYNREKYIAEAINSVLNSTYQNFELIIVDDQSVDSTFDIAFEFQKKDSRIKLYKNELNLGQFKNRNRAIELAKGPLIKFLDSDDALTKTGLETMVKSICQYPLAGIAVPVKAAYKNNVPQQLNSHDSVMLHYKGENHLCYGPTATIFTKEALQHVGGFEEAYGILADTLLNIKIAAVYNTVLFQKGLFFWRRHNEQITEEQSDDVRMIKERYLIMKATMNYPAMPLQKNEVALILNNFTKINTRHFIKYLFKGKLSDAIKIKNSTEISLSKLIKALFQRNKIATK